MNRAIGQPHASNPLAFAPAAPSVGFTQAGDFANAGPCREGLDAGNFAQNLETHREIVSSSVDTVNVGRSVFLAASNANPTRSGDPDSPAIPPKPNSPATAYRASQNPCPAFSGHFWLKIPDITPNLLIPRLFRAVRFPTGVFPPQQHLRRNGV
jgi:hypothetical protein